jgi:beta-phosphoglucomutase family hydrolase
VGKDSTAIDGYAAALFDLDGVLTPTAEVHRRAWQEMFTPFMDAHQAAPYTEADYFTYLDGKPRYDGVRDLLASRGITLPDGDLDDPAAAETVCGLGNRKNLTFTNFLKTNGVAGYPGSLRLLDYLATTPMKLAVVSSSANAEAVLQAAGLRDRFSFVVDARLAANENLAGKPAPDTYLRGAQLAGVSPDQAVVFEDALSGVAAGRAGSFGLVVGVDRGVGATALRQAGADLVVADLGELAP